MINDEIQLKTPSNFNCQSEFISYFYDLGRNQQADLATQEVAPAQRALATICYKEKDYSSFKFWLKKAMDNNDAMAKIMHAQSLVSKIKNQLKAEVDVDKINALDEVKDIFIDVIYFLSGIRNDHEYHDILKKQLVDIRLAILTMVTDAGMQFLNNGDAERMRGCFKKAIDMSDARAALTLATHYYSKCDDIDSAILNAKLALYFSKFDKDNQGMWGLSHSFIAKLLFDKIIFNIKSHATSGLEDLLFETLDHLKLAHIYNNDRCQGLLSRFFAFSKDLLGDSTQTQLRQYYDTIETVGMHNGVHVKIDVIYKYPSSEYPSWAEFFYSDPRIEPDKTEFQQAKFNALFNYMNLDSKVTSGPAASGLFSGQSNQCVTNEPPRPNH